MSLAGQASDWVRAQVYVRRAAVLSCAGIPVAIARQLIMPLVSVADWEDVAGVVHADPKSVGLLLGLEAA
jgi:hypothetical protein